jgi:hypothetical protein
MLNVQVREDYATILTPLQERWPCRARRHGA